jgi:CRP/FNR family transcriptional regulator, cyclic AMP receptor protein
MSLVLDASAFQKKCAGLAMERHQAGVNVLTSGSKTERLFVLRSGSVEIVKDGVQIAKVSAPGAVFGELAVLLDQAHTADVRTLEESDFYVANAATLLAHDSAVPLYVAAILAQRLDRANQALVEIKRQLRAGEPRSVIGKTVEKVEQLLSPNGDLFYPSYSTNPFVPDESTH